MLISRIYIKHFRCLRECELALPNYTALVGPNGVGKSTVLEAIRFVLDPKFPVNERACNPDCEHLPLEVTVTFRDLSDPDKDKFANYLSADGALTITRRYSFREEGFESEYVALTLKHQLFDDIRLKLRAGENVPAKDAYNDFAGTHPNYGLPRVTKYVDIEGNLVAWERANTTKCIIGETTIGTRTLTGLGWPPLRLIFISAVKDASEDVEGAHSPLQEILGLMVIEPASAKPEMDEIRARVASEYRRIFPLNSPELKSVASTVNSDLGAFAPGSEVRLTWDQDFEPSLDPPPVNVEVIEDDYASDISQKGQGVQRAVIVSMVSVADSVRESLLAKGEATANRPERDVVLMIEEPELYQHPIRARHFADALRRRTEKASSLRTQVIFTTHSPNFLSLNDFEGIRLLRRHRVPKMKVPMRKVGFTTLDEVAAELQKAQQTPSLLYTGENLRSRLHGILDTSLREGFFADSIVLVEGDNDQGTIVGAFKQRSFDYEAYGVAVLPVNGKGNLDKALVIFRQLGIPTYVLFDGDAGGDNSKKPKKSGSKSRSKKQQKVQKAAANSVKQNRALLSLLGLPAEDYPQTQVNNGCAIFEENFDKTLEEEFGTEFSTELGKSASNFGYEDIEKGRKVPDVMRRALEALGKKGLQSQTLSALMDRLEASARKARQALATNE
jgi:putative ATP-dependent endonuclease of the OLD family